MATKKESTPTYTAGLAGGDQKETGGLWGSAGTIIGSTATATW